MGVFFNEKRRIPPESKTQQSLVQAAYVLRQISTSLKPLTKQEP